MYLQNHFTISVLLYFLNDITNEMKLQLGLQTKRLFQNRTSFVRKRTIFKINICVIY